MELATPDFTPIPEPIWVRAERNQQLRHFYKGRRPLVRDTSEPTRLEKDENGAWKIRLNQRYN